MSFSLLLFSLHITYQLHQFQMLNAMLLCIITTRSLHASNSHNGLNDYCLALAAYALLLQCLQMMSTEYTDCKGHVPLNLRLLQQLGSLAVTACWLCLPAALATTTVRLHDFAQQLQMVAKRAITQQPATRCLSH